MRLVVDTNVFVSALIRPGESFISFIDYIDRHATVLYSAETLTELVDVLRRQKFSKYTTAREVAEFVAWIAEAGELISVEHSLAASRDLSDDKFLSLAVEGRADYIVSGDKDLLVLGHVGNIPILSPADFLGMIEH